MENLFFNIFLVVIQFINVLYAFFELSSLLAGYRPVNSGLDFLNRMLAAAVHEGCNVKDFPRVLQNAVDNGT